MRWEGRVRAERGGKIMFFPDGSAPDGEYPTWRAGDNVKGIRYEDVLPLVGRRAVFTFGGPGHNTIKAIE